MAQDKKKSSQQDQTAKTKAVADIKYDQLWAPAIEITEEPEAAPSPAAIAVVEPDEAPQTESKSAERAAVDRAQSAALSELPRAKPRLQLQRTAQGFAFAPFEPVTTAVDPVASLDSASLLDSEVVTLPEFRRVALCAYTPNDAQRSQYQAHGVEPIATHRTQSSRFGGVESLAQFGTNGVSLMQLPYTLERMGDDSDPQEDIVSLMAAISRVNAHGALIDVTVTSAPSAQQSCDPLQRRILSSDFMALLNRATRQSAHQERYFPLMEQLEQAQINFAVQLSELSLTDKAQEKRLQLLAMSQRLREKQAQEQAAAQESTEQDLVPGQEYTKAQAQEAEEKLELDNLRGSAKNKPTPRKIAIGGLYSFVNFSGTLAKPIAPDELDLWIKSDPAAYHSLRYTLINLKYPYQAIAQVRIPELKVAGLRPDDSAAQTSNQAHAQTPAQTPAATKAQASTQAPAAATSTAADSASAQHHDAAPRPASPKPAASITLSPVLMQEFTMAVHDEREQLGCWEMYQSRELMRLKQVDPLATSYLRYFLNMALLSKDGAPLKVAVVGADVGYFALLCARTHHSISVDAFEPNAQKCRLLSYNVGLNSTPGKVQVYHCALGASEGSAQHHCTYVMTYDPRCLEQLEQKDRAQAQVVVQVDNYDALQAKLIGPKPLTARTAADYERWAQHQNLETALNNISDPEFMRSMQEQQAHERKWRHWSTGDFNAEQPEEVAVLSQCAGVVLSGKYGQSTQTLHHHQVTLSAQDVHQAYQAPQASVRMEGESELSLDIKQAHDLLTQLAFFEAKPLFGRAWWQREQYGRPQAHLTYRVPQHTMAGFYAQLKAQHNDLPQPNAKSERSAEPQRNTQSERNAELQQHAQLQGRAQLPDLVIIDAQGAAHEVLAGMKEMLVAGARPIIYVRSNVLTAEKHGITAHFAAGDELVEQYGYIPCLVHPSFGLRSADEKHRLEAVSLARQAAIAFEEDENQGRLTAVASGKELLHLFYLPSERFEVQNNGLRVRS